MTAVRACVWLVLAGVSVACSSSGDGAPVRDLGVSDGGGGDSSATGGSGGGDAGDSGSAGSAANDGDAALEAPDTGANLDLPTGCAPDEMGFVCNPVNNVGCDSAAGEACEYGIEEYFMCYPAPNDVAEGGACDWELGPYCQATLTCDPSSPESTSGVCRRHCCSDTDCESPETCVANDAEFGTLGVCR